MELQQKSIPIFISVVTKNDLPDIIGRFTTFYSDVLEQERFEGIGEIIEIVEQKESMLISKDMYQNVRMKVRFLTYNELQKYNIPIAGGYYNDRFAPETTTHKHKKVLLKTDINDRDICTLEYTRVKKNKILTRKERILKTKKFTFHYGCKG